MKYPIVTCTNCSTSFKFKTKVKAVKDIEITYSECPECRWPYFSYITNSEIRSRMQKTEKIRQSANQIIKSEEMRLYILYTRQMMKELAGQNQALISKYMKQPTKKEDK